MDRLLWHFTFITYKTHINSRTHRMGKRFHRAAAENAPQNRLTKFRNHWTIFLPCCCFAFRFATFIGSRAKKKRLVASGACSIVSLCRNPIWPVPNRTSKRRMHFSFLSFPFFAAAAAASVIHNQSVGSCFWFFCLFGFFSFAINQITHGKHLPTAPFCWSASAGWHVVRKRFEACKNSLSFSTRVSSITAGNKFRFAAAHFL